MDESGKCPEWRLLSPVAFWHSAVYMQGKAITLNRFYRSNLIGKRKHS